MMPVILENKNFKFSPELQAKPPPSPLPKTIGNFLWFLGVERQISKMGGRNLRKLSHIVWCAIRMIPIILECESFSKVRLPIFETWRSTPKKHQFFFFFWPVNWWKRKYLSSEKAGIILGVNYTMCVSFIKFRPPIFDIWHSKSKNHEKWPTFFRPVT